MQLLIMDIVLPNDLYLDYTMSYVYGATIQRYAMSHNMITVITHLLVIIIKSPTKACGFDSTHSHNICTWPI